MSILQAKCPKCGMTTIHKKMIHFTEIKDSSDIALSDHTKDLMVICELDNVNTIEFQNGYSLISDSRVIKFVQEYCK